MTHALKTVLRQAMIKAVLAYLTSCGHAQAEIDRVTSIEDNEILQLVSHSSHDGTVWKIVVHETEFDPHTMLSIPLDSSCLQTPYLIRLGQVAEKVSNPELGHAALELLTGLKDATGYRPSENVSCALFIGGIVTDDSVIAYVEALLTEYTKEHIGGTRLFALKGGKG